EWYQWFVPAPIRIIDRPLESSEFCANSRPSRTILAIGTEVISEAQAGVQAVVGSSYPVGQVPPRPGRDTPYWASIRSNTVVTTCSPTRRTGTPRGSWATFPSGANRGSSTSSLGP